MPRKMKDSGIEWIGEIPKSWSVQRGKTLFTQRSEKGNTISLQLLSPTQKYGVIPQSEYEKLSGMKAVKLDVQTDYSTLKTVHKGDYCISLRSFQGGFEYSDYEGVVSPAYQVFYPYVDVDSGYYKYLFKDRAFIDKMNSFTMSLRDGKTIAFSDFANSRIPVPPLSDQHRIAYYLDTQCAKIDAVLEQTRNSIEEYKKLKQSVITQAVTKGIRLDRPMKKSGMDWVREIPTDWKMTKIKYISSGVGDGLHAAPAFASDGLYYFINGNNLGDKQIKIKNNTNAVSEEEYSKYNQPKLCPNAILVALNGTYGTVSFYNGERIMLGKSAGYINLLPDIKRNFVRYALLSDYSKRQMDDSLAGTTIANISLRTIRNISIPWPTVNEQEEVSMYLDSMCTELDGLLTKKTQLLLELESYKKSLIYECVTGKRGVYMGNKPVSSNPEELLQEILNHRYENGSCDCDYWRQKFENLNRAEDAQLRSMFKELIDAKLIRVFWADNYPYNMDVLNKGLTYFEEKEKKEEQDRRQKNSDRLHDYVLLFIGAILTGIVTYILFHFFGIGG